MMMKPVFGASAALLVAMLGGWAWGVPAASDLARAARVSEQRDDLREAHNALLGARVDLYERDYGSAGRQLEDARDLLRRAAARAERLGWPDEVNRFDLAVFEADINEAQRLLRRLDRETNALGHMVQGVVEGALRAH